MRKTLNIIFTLFILLNSSSFALDNHPKVKKHRTDKKDHYLDHLGHHGKIRYSPFGNRFHYYNYYYKPYYYRTHDGFNIRIDIPKH